MSAESSTGWWGNFNLQEIVLAAVEGHYMAEAAENTRPVETAAPIPDPDRTPVIEKTSLIRGVPDVALAVGAGLLVLVVVVASK